MLVQAFSKWWARTGAHEIVEPLLFKRHCFYKICKIVAPAVWGGAPARRVEPLTLHQKDKTVSFIVISDLRNTKQQNHVLSAGGKRQSAGAIISQ